MTTSMALRPSVRAALSALIDYAGLYPPAELPLGEAIEEFRAARAGRYAWMLGRFIVPAALLRESSQQFDGPFSVIAGGLDDLPGIGAIRAEGVAVECVELRPTGRDVKRLSESRASAGLDDLPVFVEIPRVPEWTQTLPDAMRALGEIRAGAKLRCGGLTADAFPSVDETAAFVACATASRVPFKATAGLHHPIRRLDAPSGFTMHGFLNLVAAAALAPRVTLGTLARIVAEEDPAAFSFDDASFAWRSERVSATELIATRNDAFVAYGSCSFAEPVDDLTGLGIIPAR